MIVGRIIKDSADVRRLIIDFANDPAGPWLDLNETIASFSMPAVAIEQSAVTPCNGSFVNLPPPADTTPLAVVSANIIGSGTQVQILLGVGTPGLTYKVTSVVLGSTSGRQKQFDIIVTIRGPL